MPMALTKFKKELKLHQENGFFKNLEIHRGIERESLRVDHSGSISQKDHPIGLGSPLTSTDITTDFSEALIELITPTFTSTESLFKHLSKLHHFVYGAMEEEILWNFSMPCAFEDESEIRIAEYGHSNMGMLKHIYRKGLKLRYGSIMQCVSGIHYNFSLSDTSWLPVVDNVTQEYINEKYLHLIRNVKRNFWFILEQCGASPITHKSYLYGRKHSLENYGKEDLFMPFATTLRMSEAGYQSPIQESLKITYNNLNEFVDAVIKGISAPYEKFKEMGLLDEKGFPQQISTGILQIENELYDIIRPKRTGPSGSRPANLLKQKGIEYIELRGIDVNPFIPEGISENKIKLLDIFLIHSLISDSPNINKQENEEIKLNQKTMVTNGRSKDVKILQKGIYKALSELRKNFYEELSLVALAMDEYSPGYLNALESEAIDTSPPSQKIMRILMDTNISFKEFGLSHSQEIAKKFRKKIDGDFSVLLNNSMDSLEQQKIIEETKDININKYVELYNSKLKRKK